MEFLQLKYFCSAAETENFSHAAKRFDIPASGISQSIKRLEKELGVRLFTRTANRVTLTEEGKIFLGAAKRSLDLLESTKAQLSDKEESVGGEIRLSVLTSRSLIMKMIEFFKEKYEDVSFVINHNTNFKANEFDIMISDEEIYYKAFERKLLLTEDLLLAVKKNNPIAKMKKINAEVLKGQNFISTTEGSSLFRHTNRICYSEGFAPNIKIQGDDPLYLRKYIELGLGIAFVPESWAEGFSDNIALLKIGDYKRHTYLFCNRERNQTRAIKLFLEMLINYISY